MGVDRESRKQPTGTDWRVVVLAVLLALLLVEVTLRIAGTYETRHEKNGKDYVSVYDTGGTRWFRKRSPGRHEDVTPKYTDQFTVNEHGFRDRDWPLEKEPGEIRIVTFGGSLVEGVGSLRPSSSYPSALSRILEKRLGIPAGISVMNGGMAGSDPVDSLQSLRQVFFDYQPDVIVQSVDQQDWKHEIPVRGGLDRFAEDGTIEARAPWFEPLFEHSHLARAWVLGILRYKPILVSRSERNRRADRAVDEICAIFEQQRAIARELGASFVVVAMDDRSEIVRQEEPSDRLRAVMECATRHASVSLELGGELGRRFSSDELEALFWPDDGHFRPHGYEAYAEIVAAAIEPLIAASIEQAE